MTTAERRGALVKCIEGQMSDEQDGPSVVIDGRALEYAAVDTSLWAGLLGWPLDLVKDLTAQLARRGEIQMWQVEAYPPFRIVEVR
jgi:hypothetical protein